MLLLVSCNDMPPKHQEESDRSATQSDMSSRQSKKEIMSVSVFISCSGEKSSKPHVLGKNLQRIIQGPSLQGSAYFYGDQQNAGADWARAICNSIASAELYVPLIDKNY